MYSRLFQICIPFNLKFPNFSMLHINSAIFSIDSCKVPANFEYTGWKIKVSGNEDKEAALVKPLCFLWTTLCEIKSPSPDFPDAAIALRSDVALSIRVLNLRFQLRKKPHTVRLKKKKINKRRRKARKRKKRISLNRVSNCC